jgi:hypothetical protein
MNNNNKAENATELAKRSTPTIELAPPDRCDPVIEFYKNDVDRTVLRENLKLTVEERLRKASNLRKSIEAARDGALVLGSGSNQQSASALPSGDYRDPVIEAYMKDVDRTLLRENLKLTVDERFQKFHSFAMYANELTEAGRRARSTNSTPGT